LIGFGTLAPAASAGSPPPGFVVEPVLGGLEAPVAIDFASDGRMFVAEKGGVIRVFKNGQLLPTPFIDLSADVNNWHERGLLGMTLHPQFPSVPYVYALYTHDPPGVADDQPGARVGRLERIEADPSNTDVAASGASARTVLLGRNGDASTITDPTTMPSLTCWRDGARVEDCIPQDARRHAIGTVTFGPDGALYVGNGDADRLPDGPLDPVTNVGAIMRIDPATGNGLSGNPFYDPSNPNSNLSKTWVHGLRNPFRFSLDPVSGQMFIGDVGALTWDSIHLGQAGMNYGWPCYEGGNHIYGRFQNSTSCQPVYAEGPRTPLYTYRHNEAGGSVIGGDWYHGTEYPAAYRGAYFFADYAQGWVKYLQPDGFGGYTAGSFLDDGAAGGTTSGLVQLISGPNGDLYWISINNGAIYRLRYTGAPPPPPAHVLSLGFEEGQGSVAADGSGNGNDADLRNGATWGVGNRGGGLALDGVNDFASVDHSPTLGGFTDKLTVAGWLHRPSAQSGWRMLISRQLATNAADQFFLGFSNGVPRFGVNTSNGGAKGVGTGGAPLNQWVHLAGVYDGSRMTLYVNGVERASGPKAGNLLTSLRPVLVGANANSTPPLAASQYLKGRVDDVRLYTRALSASEVAELAHPVQPPQVTITDPVADMTLDVGSTVNFSATAQDSVDGDLTSDIRWSAVLHHIGHTHPDFLPPTTGGSGSFILDDHGDDMFFELCAEVTNSGGRSARDCVNIRPRTTTVTIGSIPDGQDVTFEEVTRPGPFTVEANVGATRTLSAPLRSGCFAFESWSDGGAATHEVTVTEGNPTYTATFQDTCSGADPPDVTIAEPVADTTLDVGSTVNFSASAQDSVDGDLTSDIRWSAVLHHAGHTHSDFLPPTTGGSGSFTLDDHGDDMFVELCAEVTNSAGRSDQDCANVRPRTTTVTIGSVPPGHRLGFGETSRAAPFTVDANVGATRTLSAPPRSGCFAFESWSDAGAATHDIVVPDGNPAYVATFGDICGPSGSVLALAFEEGQGIVAADGSGNGNDADLLNGASWGGGQFGGGLAFDGVNDIAAVDDSPTLNQFTRELTVAAWVRRPSTATGWGIVASRQHGTTNHDQFFLGFKDGSPRFGIHTPTTAMLPKIGTGSTPLNQWVHLAGVYDGATLTLYVNGVVRQSAAKTGDISASTRPVLVGGNSNGIDPLAANENLAGEIDEVRLYSRALSASEIAALATP
jgi:glucose/arabinose dehydrogenase